MATDEPNQGGAGVTNGSCNAICTCMHAVANCIESESLSYTKSYVSMYVRLYVICGSVTLGANYKVFRKLQMYLFDGKILAA